MTIFKDITNWVTSWKLCEDIADLITGGELSRYKQEVAQERKRAKRWKVSSIKFSRLMNDETEQANELAQEVERLKTVVAALEEGATTIYLAGHKAAEEELLRTPQQAAKVLLDAMNGTGPFDKFMDAADAMNVDNMKGLGPIPQLGSALRAIAEQEDKT